MKAAEEKQALHRVLPPCLKWQDENCGTSVAVRASRGVAPTVSRCEMPSRMSALGKGCSVARPEPLSFLFLSQQLRIVLPPDHVRR